jgi:hypothetical protein
MGFDPLGLFAPDNQVGGRKGGRGMTTCLLLVQLLPGVTTTVYQKLLLEAQLWAQQHALSVQRKEIEPGCLMCAMPLDSWTPCAYTHTACRLGS